MNYNDNPLMEPIFFTPPPGRGGRYQRLHKGGGGGGTPYYANQDRLAGVQADVAQNLYNQYADYAPQSLQGLSQMASEAGSGLYTQQLRDRALADSAASASMQNQATERQLSSMGVNPNDPRFAGSARATGLGNAAMMARNANAANSAGDNMSWARQQDFYNSLAGLPSQSATMLASASNTQGQLGNAMQGQANANAQGYGQFGAQIANSMFKADGGIVERGYAAGGQTAGAGMPRINDWRSYPATWKPESMSTMDKVGAIAAPIAGSVAANAAGKGMASLGSAAWQGLTSQAAAPVVEAAITPVATGLSTTAAGAGAAGAGAAGAAGAGAAGAGAAGAGAAGAGAAGAGAAGAGAAGAGAAGAGAAGAGAAGAAGAGAGMAAVGAAVPWVGAALLAAHALDLFADGGPVPEAGGRADMRGGGHVPGLPMREAPDTSDHVPAWVTPKEYVLNTHATQIVGKKDLDAVNKAGLAKRDGKAVDAKQQRAKAAVRRIKAKAKAARKGA